MKTGVDTCQARRIHKLRTKLLWDQLDICNVDSWVATVSQLTEISEPEGVTPPGCIGIELSRLPLERNYITTCHKIMPVSECCGLIARLGDAMRSLQPAVFCIFEADAGQVRSLTSPRFQASRSRNWLEQIVQEAALETPQSKIGIVLKNSAYNLTQYALKDSNLFP